MGLNSSPGWWLRAGGYALSVAGGAVLAFLVDDMVTPLGILPWLWWVMCAWLVVGGGLSLGGTLAGRWLGEYVGLPLASAAMVGFALLQGQASHWSLFAIPSVALLGSFGLLLLSRWRDVSALYRVAAVRGTP